MGIRQDLQTIAYLQEKEAEKKTLQERELARLQELKNDIINIADGFFMDILDDEEQRKDILFYYFNNKNEIIDNIYLKISKKTIIKEVIKSYGETQKEKVLKYDDFNALHLKEYIESILNDYIKKIVKEEREKEKELVRREKSQQKEFKSDLMSLIIAIYKQSGMNSISFYNTITQEKARQKIFNNHNIEESIENIAIYTEIVKDFKKYYCLGCKESKKAKRSLFPVGLAVILGIFEGLKSKK